MEWTEPTPSVVPITDAYHHGRTVKRDRRIDQSTREFIAWDGEGVNLQGEGKPQSYVLFGCSEDHISDVEGLSTFQMLDFIISVGERFPRAIHVGFAFGYDSNMIVKTLAPVTLARLHRQGWVRLTRRSNGAKYTITFAKGKYFRVTRYKDGYHHQHNSTAKTTVQIFDIFSFFASSFIKAYEDMCGPIPDIIRSGKAGRNTFSIDEFDVILKYWTLEIQLLRELAEELRRRVVSAGFHITQWYGPGALASYAMREHGIKEHMSVSTDEVREASRYGYAGGRFELFKVGRTVGPVYSIDINSAYPDGIRELPSLSEGVWHYVASPSKLTRFGIYHVRLREHGGFVRLPSPLFHRDKDHNISFPWNVDGWYWSPEATQAKAMGGEILEGWEYRGARTRPFIWVSQMYEQRREWKKAGISAQLALKLCLNSMYGKMAQRVGWNPETQRMPPFHQLEWAGWVTSYTRAKLFDVMRRIPFDQLVAVETDGIYTTMSPGELGLEESDQLGGWSIDEYSEVLYVQSGLAWLRSPDGEWSEKRRGLDGCKTGHRPEECDCEGVFSLNACRRYLSTLSARPNREFPWESFKGSTTRFVGLGQALASSRFSETHCVWLHTDREILPGTKGKRVHVPFSCRACDLGLSALESAHDLVINSLASIDPHSYPHAIPWEDWNEGHAQWRDQEDQEMYMPLSGLE